MFPGYFRGWQWYIQWGTTAPLVGKQVFHEKKKLNIIHDCQWPHWNSWSNVHLSFHLFSHLVGMYIYIYICLYTYILVLLYWKYLIFGVMSLFPPPSPHFSCRKSGQRSQAARSLETRWVGSWRLMRASNVGWMGYGHPSHNGNPYDEWWIWYPMISHDIPWYPYSWSDCTHVLPNCNGDPLGTLEALWLTSGFLIWDAAMGIPGCRCTSRILADSASKFMPHV